MANYKQVNVGNETIWLDIDKVLYIIEPADKCSMETRIRLITGDTLTLSENCEELLEDWGIISQLGQE